MGRNSSKQLPSLRASTYDRAAVVDYINAMSGQNQDTGFGAVTYAPGFTSISNAYAGVVYSPTLNRVYLVPNKQCTVSTWHYIDCDSSSVVTYTHNQSFAAASDGYYGGEFMPTLGRIYLAPSYLRATYSMWHYINCYTGSVVAYSHGTSGHVLNGYRGASYSPVADRMYLVPYGMGTTAVWHYIDGSNGSVVAYTHGATISSATAYFGGAYSPMEDKIYFAPYNWATAAAWHYVNCSDGSIVAYTHGATAVTSAYVGAVYAPTQNRVYLVPYGQATVATWHYIDCTNGSVVAYTHGATAVTSAYVGGVYSPATNRIYLCASAQSGQTTWHYIDCTSGSVVTYTHGSPAPTAMCFGGTYAPTLNRIYFAPTAGASTWFYLQEFSSVVCSPAIANHFGHGGF